MYVSQRNTQREQRDRHVEQCATDTFLCFTCQNVLTTTSWGCTPLHFMIPNIVRINVLVDTTQQPVHICATYTDKPALCL